jgi:Uma2 family endonuclease
MRIRPNKSREPDLLLLISATDPRNKSRYWEGADLALEVVSEDNPERDLIDKRVDYAEAKIPEYGIVNPLDETVTVLQLTGNAYTEAGIYHRGESARSILRPKFAVDASAIFDSQVSK